MTKKLRVVKVEWRDAWSDSDVHVPGADYYGEAWPVETVGFLEKSTRKVVVVSQSYQHRLPEEIDANATPGMKHTVCIPRGMVKSIVELEAKD